uniref:Secernin 1 n=1 Tax=Papio anubis TaxID=9555 RepID=A0A8I5N1V3_PAPAN
MDAEHPELRSYAQSQGWWTGEGEFNFSEVFSPVEDHLDCGAGKDSLEKQEESITVQTMMNTLRDKASGVCIDSESFLTTASGVSVLPQNRSAPCIHYFTGTPDPSRSIFKPFIFVDDVKLVPKTQSPCFGDDDPAKKEPRFQEKPDRRHELYKAHEWARAILESDQVSLHEGHGGGGGRARSARKEAGKQMTSETPPTHPVWPGSSQRPGSWGLS